MIYKHDFLHNIPINYDLQDIQPHEKLYRYFEYEVKSTLWEHHDFLSRVGECFSKHVNFLLHELETEEKMPIVTQKSISWHKSLSDDDGAIQCSVLYVMINKSKSIQP